MKAYNWVRFDWAMKRLLRNKASYEVVEGFLSELLQKDVKIIKLLESESNQEYAEDKYNRVDLLAENVGGDMFIIEIQNQNELDYFYRMSYGTSKIITEYLSIGQHYHDIKKVYSVNIVYFDLGQGEDYVYHGTTDFYGIHKKDKLVLSENQRNKFDLIEPRDIFPEYYVLKVNSFNDVAKDKLDEWIYYFKNSEIKEDFDAKGLSRAKELLKYDQLTLEERRAYSRHIENLRYQASIAWSMKAEEEMRIQKEAMQRGRAEGIKEGIKEEKRQMAIKMLSHGMSVDEISNLTDLPNEEIENLKSGNSSIPTPKD